MHEPTQPTRLTDAEELRALAEFYRQGLLQDVIPFWERHGFDQRYGGFLTCLDRDGTLVDSDKGMWQQGRASWLFAKLYNTVQRRPEWLALASQGIDFLQRYGTDPTDGRMWFHVTRDGRPIRKRRYAFTESFAAIAYGEYARATGKPLYAELAVGAFERFLTHHRNPPPEQEKFTDQRPTRGLGFPMIAMNTAQELRESIGLESANATIEDCIQMIHQYHVDGESQCVLETVGAEGERLEHFDGRTLTPGHAIEGAWFIIREGRYRQDLELVKLGCRMLDWMWRRGWDHQYGGIRYFVSRDDRPIQEYWHDMKFWWPQNEAIIATLLARLQTGDPQYRRWHRQVHDWAHKHFADPVHGEWFGYLHRDGSLSSSLKGNLWKGPFHLPRMQLTCWQMLTQHLASACG